MVTLPLKTIITCYASILLLYHKDYSVFFDAVGWMTGRAFIL